MDIFKQKRYLVLVIILLVILNLGTLLTFWLNRPHQHRFQSDNRGPDQENMYIQQILKDELGFEKGQVKQYLDLRSELRNQIIPINDEIKRLKKQMFDKALENNISPALSDSLLKLTLEKRAQMEQLTFQHLLELKKLCNPEQQKKLQLLIHIILGPPPGGELPPRSNN